MAYLALARLLEYPREDVASVLAECLQEADPPTAGVLDEFRQAIRDLPPGRLEEVYTQAFDLEPETCLYIGHHLFGEDWRRGMFLAGLKRQYAEAGFSGGAEMPDFIPVVLRFLARHPPGPETGELLRECVIPAVTRVLRTAERKNSLYAPVLRALLRLLNPEDDGVSEPEDLLCRPFSSSPFPILR